MSPRRVRLPRPLGLACLPALLPALLLAAACGGGDDVADQVAAGAEHAASKMRAEAVMFGPVEPATIDELAEEEAGITLAVEAGADGPDVQRFRIADEGGEHVVCLTLTVTHPALPDEIRQEQQGQAGAAPEHHHEGEGHEHDAPATPSASPGAPMTEHPEEEQLDDPGARPGGAPTAPLPTRAAEVAEGEC